MVEVVEVVLEQCPSPPPLISKKLSNAVRLIIFMIQKRSRKLQVAMPDLQVMVQRGKILGKSFNDLMLRHNTALGCTSHEVRMSFVSPREYEFSCSSSPPHRSYSSAYRRVTNRKNRYNNYCNKHASRRGSGGSGGGHGNRIVPRSPAFHDDHHEDDVILPVTSFKMFKAETPVSVSGSSLPRRIKTTTTRDSSSSSLSFRSCQDDDDDEEFHVDKAAEEFIQKFYRELMMQKWMAREAADRFV